MREPPEEYSSRPLLREWVKELKSRLRTSLVAPPIVLPGLLDAQELQDGTPDQSAIRFCKIYCLGGNHITTAMRELQEEGVIGEQPWEVEMEVYRNLTKQEARRLGNIHNFRCETAQPTFLDRAFQARRLLMEMT